MRYLVTARLVKGKAQALMRAIRRRTLGQGSVAEGEYLRNMRQARQMADGTVKWVEICYCSEPLEEERPYWEEYFQLVRIKNAHSRRRCRDLNGEEAWACSDCDCTDRLESKMENWGQPFLNVLDPKK